VHVVFERAPLRDSFRALSISTYRVAAELRGHLLESHVGNIRPLAGVFQGEAAQMAMLVDVHLRRCLAQTSGSIG
jgi:hypothetical protein